MIQHRMIRDDVVQHDDEPKHNKNSFIPAAFTEPNKLQLTHILFIHLFSMSGIGFNSVPDLRDDVFDVIGPCPDLWNQSTLILLLFL